jgi:hypothetical protein
VSERIRWRKNAWCVKALDFLPKNPHGFGDPHGSPPFISLLQKLAADVGMDMTWVYIGVMQSLLGYIEHYVG